MVLLQGIDEGFDVVEHEQRSDMASGLKDGLLKIDDGGELRRVKLVVASQAVVEALGKLLVDAALAALIQTGKGLKGKGKHAVLVGIADTFGHSVRQGSLADAPEPVEHNKIGRA